MRRMYLVVPMVMALAGCVTKPPRPDQLRTPTPDRLLAFQDPSDGDATVIVTRDVGFQGSGCYGAVFVDGKVVAKVATGERITLHIPSGDHVLGTWNTGSGLCGYREGKDRRETAVTLKTGETRRFRIIIDPNAGPSLAPTTIE